MCIRDSFRAFQKSGLAETFGIRTREEMYAHLSSAAVDINPIGDRHLEFEKDWALNKRPYYDVYPSIIPMLTRLSLNFPGNAITHYDDDIYVAEGVDAKLGPVTLVTPELIANTEKAKSGLKFTSLLIRLPKMDHGLSYDDPEHGYTLARTIFVGFQPVTRKAGGRSVTLGITVGVDIGETELGVPVHTMRAFPLDKRPVNECLDALPRHKLSNEGMQVSDEFMTTCVKLAITLCLLEDNPELIEPDVLSKDRPRLKDADEELRDRLIDKARRRGKNGYLVGKVYEDNHNMTPHTRRPHPCLVWTGKGKTVPKIVIRKGSLIHRKKVSDIPTGYLDKPET
jgi:hypothetical protein